MTAYNYRTLTKKLKKIGFREYRRGKGSHVLWVRDTDKIVVPIPFHGNKDFRAGTLQAICNEIGVKNRHELDKL